MKKQVHVSTNKTEAYIATVLLFNQVKIMSQSKVGGWKLVETYTSTTDKHFITEYSNGKMRIMAASRDGVHTYTIREEAK